VKILLVPLTVAAVGLIVATAAAQPVTPPQRPLTPQTLPPPLSRPADPIERARERATQPLPSAPAPAVPSERWVPERRVYLPQPGGVVIVPGHFERRISDQIVVVPTLPAYSLAGQRTVIIPGGERLSPELRQSP